MIRRQVTPGVPFRLMRVRYIAAMAAMKSGLSFPENRWLIRQPERDAMMRGSMTYAEFMAPVGQWALKSGLKVEASAGAFLSFEFSALPDAMVSEQINDNIYFQTVISAVRKRVQVINAFALCLHSATIEEENTTYGGFRVTHEDLLHFNDPVSNIGGPGMMTLPVIPGTGSYLLSRYRHDICSEKIIATACHHLDDVLRSDHEKALDLVVLMNHALVACKGHDFELAVATAWTVCESLLDSWWLEYAESQASTLSLPVNSDRRKQWAGRDFTASIIIETMTLAGVVPSDLSKVIGEVRGKRNKWIHGIAAPNYGDAVKAVTLTRDLLEKVVGLDIQLAPTVGVSGI